MMASNLSSNVRWRMKISENPQAERIAISAVLLVMLTIMVSQATPDDFFLVTGVKGKALFTATKRGLSPVATALGLRQDWTMFAPNPTRLNTYIDAEITYRDGKKHTWTFPQMEELGYAERYAKERYRKFANERVWVRDNSVLWPDAARFIARLNAHDPSNPPVIVRLVHYWSEILPPPEAGEEPRPERWSRDVFFTYTVDPGELR
jgi:hypothetical protein